MNIQSAPATALGSAMVAASEAPGDDFPDEMAAGAAVRAGGEDGGAVQ